MPIALTASFGRLAKWQIGFEARCCFPPLPLHFELLKSNVILIQCSFIRGVTDDFTDHGLLFSAVASFMPSHGEDITGSWAWRRLLHILGNKILQEHV